MTGQPTAERACTSCRSPLHPESRFCSVCGVSAAQCCAHCGDPMEAEARFCGSCGKPTSAPAGGSGSWAVPGAPAGGSGSWAVPSAPEGGSGSWAVPSAPAGGSGSWAVPSAPAGGSAGGPAPGGSGAFYVPSGMPEIKSAPSPVPKSSTPAPSSSGSFPAVTVGPAFCVGCGTAVLPGAALCAPCTEVHTVCVECRAVSDKTRRVCDCRTLLRLPEDYKLDPSDYEYAGDRQALNALRALKPVNMLADYIAHKLGKPFIEGQFIGSAIRVSDDQFPHIHKLAEHAATVLCMHRLPHIYIAGDRFWNSDTYGTGNDSFIVLGSSLARSLSEAELLFVIAKELGHAKSGHAMYRTVAQIVAGSHSNNLMAGGLLGFLDLKRLVSLPLELPLMAWLRQSETTADSAGLLVVGDLEIARKALVLMSLRAPDLYKQINLDAWLKQQDDLDGKVSSLNEFVSQSSPFVSRRVRFLGEFVKTPGYEAVRARMTQSKDLAPIMEAIETCKHGEAPAKVVEKAAAPAPPPESDAETIRGRCPKCSGTYSVARAKLPAQGKVHLKCKGCGSTFPVQR